MRRSAINALALCAFVFVAGCASSGTSNTATPPGFKPPTIISGGNHPELTLPPSGTNSLSVTIEVMVDASGTPDMKTLKLSGTGAESNTYALETWLSQVGFKPATLNGVPVAGPYKVTLVARRTVTRVR